MTNAKTTKSVKDVFAQIQEAMRDSYLEASEDLRYYAEKVRDFNRHKSAVRDYIRALREVRATVLSDAREHTVNLRADVEEDAAVLTKLFDKHAHAYTNSEVEYELGIPNRVPPKGTTTTPSLDAEISKWEEALNSIGDDTRLVSVDLQNALQRQQQAVQYLSNVSKMLHDTSMSIIRNIGG